MSNRLKSGLMCSSALAVMCTSLVWTLSVQARPEIFPNAIAYGAKDCSFCHQSAAGGTALNERGAWLLAERTKRDVVEIDVSWLAARGEQADATRTVEIDDTSVAKTALPSASVEASAEQVPMDYTTQWGEWPSYSGGLHAQKYSPLPHINKSNIQDLELAWVWEAKIDNGRSSDGQQQRRRRGGAGQVFKGSPLMVNGKVYVRTRYSTVVAIDAETGVELWEYDPGTRLGQRPAMFGFTTRGLGYHEQVDCTGETPCERIILLASDGWLIALDAESGELIPSFANGGKVDLTQGLRRPLDRAQVSWSHAPLVCKDVVVVGSQTNDMSQFQFLGTGDWNQNLPLGDVRGFDPVTGEQMWVFKTVPQEGEVGVDTWGNESWRWMGNTNVWSTFSCDPELGHVYLPVTAPTNHMYGGDRPGDNLFGTSIVAVDMRSGERVWHYQVTHHDIWDYDLPAPPVVADIVVNGQPRKVVAQVTKVGFLFVLDRTNGEPIWPIEEREVPASKLEGEVAAATQPHPTKPPPFEMQGLTFEDLNDLTPEIHARSKALVKDFDFGPLYTPISLRRTVLLPGIGGGANWPGAAFDPIERRLYVSSRREPTVARAVPVDKERWGIPYREDWGFPKINSLPFIKPPWSSITAYDMDEGEIAWQIPNGEGPKQHPLLASVKDELPDLGSLNANPGILVLPELLIMGHAGQPSTLKALDKATGEKIWSVELNGYFQSPHPISYMHKGIQYIAIGTGLTFQPSRISAFRLADKDSTE